MRGQPGGALNTETPIHVRGDVSSQFLTALLLALPLASDSCSGAQPIAIDVDGELEATEEPKVFAHYNLPYQTGAADERRLARR